MTKQKDWFKLKKYPHLDKQIRPQDRKLWVESYIASPDKIERHSFLPFIHKTKRVRKFRKTYSDKDGNAIKTGVKALRKASTKSRELYYASHLDSLIYSYYSRILADLYEHRLKKEDLDEVVLAYRSIPVSKGKPKGPNKCNIDFANDIFEFILNYPDDYFVAITFDIKGFFDELNHELLKEVWCDLLGKKKMGKDHFNVFKSLTRFAFVDIVDLFKFFQDQIIVQDIDPDGRPKPARRKRVSRIKYLKKEHAIAFCTKKEFLKNKAKLIRNKRYVTDETGNLILRDHGIPQGTPISSVLANAYMLKFDSTMNQHLKAVNGIYRRYSDDMIVVCPVRVKQAVIDEFEERIKDVRLRIQDSKTQVFHFYRKSEVLSCAQEFENGLNYNKKLSYLGFDFDGQFTYLKPGGLAAYYRKMKRHIARSKFYARQNGPNNGELFKRRILNRYSYKGSFRKRTWKYSQEVKGFVNSDKYDWGNYLAYSRKAEKIMVNNKIRGQTRKHWSKLNKELKSK